MINIQIDADKTPLVFNVECAGTLDTILSDLAVAISDIYFMLKKDSEAAASVFKAVFSTDVADPESMIWTINQEALAEGEADDGES